jgi:sporulation protein YtfJ
MSENKLNDIIGTSLEKIRALADGETVIGNPINTPNGTTIIPVSRVSMGFASGGLDYNGKKAATAAQNFGGGGGTGVTVSPVAFLVLSPDGEVKLLPVTAAPQGGDTIDKVTAFIERSPDLIEKFKRIFTSKKKKEEKAEDTETAETPADLDETKAPEGI